MSICEARSAATLIMSIRSLALSSRPIGAPQEPQAANDDGQQVVEVVGHPAGHPAHQFELLRLPQRLLDLPPFGHVEKRDDVATVGRRIVKDLDRGPSLSFVF